MKRFLMVLLFGLTFFDLNAQSIKLESDPPGAAIWFKGEFLGETPLVLLNRGSTLPFFSNPGKAYNIIFYKDFYEGELIKISYERGKDLKYSVSLEPQIILTGYKGHFMNGRIYTLPELIVWYKDELAYLMNDLLSKYGAPLLYDLEPREDYDWGKWYVLNPYFSPERMDNSDKMNYLHLNLLINETPREKGIKASLLELDELYPEQGETREENKFIITDENQGILKTNYPDDPAGFTTSLPVNWIVERNGIIFWSKQEDMRFFNFWRDSSGTGKIYASAIKPLSYENLIYSEK